MMPEHIGAYRIIRKLGEGNTADVYLAVQQDNDKLFALKVCKTGDKQEDFLAQLRNEAALLSVLRAPAIPKFYGYQETDGYFYNVLEYIEGSDLNQYFEEMESPIAESAAIQWGLRLCEILEILHNTQPQPLIYSFIAPLNMMIDKNNEVFLIDFGKTVVFDDAMEYPQIGYKGYSAPEQYDGKRNPQSDFYSLGVLLYHATTGRDPHKDPDNFDIFIENPPRSINAALSERFEALILKAVAHEVEDRFQDVGEFRRALTDCM